jgi:putative aldouronate transport system substrate-binding protein
MKKITALSMCILSVCLVVGCTAQKEEKNATTTPIDTQQPPVKVKWMVDETPTQPMKPDAPSIKEILKKKNVDIALELVPSSNYTEKKNSLIATNNIPDIIKVASKDIQDFGRTGMFLPISDYMDDMPNFKKLVNERPEIKKLQVDGKLYGFPVLEKYRINVAPQPVLRTDLLAKHNLAVPKSFDELYTVLKALKAAYPDSYPFTVRSKTLGTLSLLAYPMGSGGTGVYYEPDDKRYVYGPSQVDFKNVVAYLNKLYTEKLLDPDYAVNTQDMAWEKLSSGKSFFYYDNNGFAAKVFNPALKQKDPNAKFEMIPPMKNSKGQIRSYRYQRDWLGNNYAISSKVKDPKALVRLFDWLYSEEGMRVSNFGVEGESYTLVNGKPTPVQSLLDKYKDKQGGMTAAIRSELGTGLLSYAVYIDESWEALITDPYMLKMADQIGEYTDKGQIQFQNYNPPFDKEETASLKKLETKVNTTFEQEIDKFIMGLKPMSEYDEFAKKLYTDGASEIEKIYNDALKRLQ